jgi:hypothetical protein
MTEFSQLARTGRNGAGRWALGLVVIGVSWLLVGGLLSVLIVLASGGDPTDPSATGTLPGYLALNVPFVLLFGGLWLVVRRVHHRPLRSLVTPEARVDRGGCSKGSCAGRSCWASPASSGRCSPRTSCA